jgi:hypothetical protein
MSRPKHSEAVLIMSTNKITCRWGGVSLVAFAHKRRATSYYRRATSIFVRSVRPSGRNNSAPTGHIFITLYIRSFRKSVQKIQVSIKPDKNNGHVKWSPMQIPSKSGWILFRMRNVSVKSWRENQNTKFKFVYNHDDYEIMCKNMVQPNAPQIRTFFIRKSCRCSVPEFLLY